MVRHAVSTLPAVAALAAARLASASSRTDRRWPQAYLEEKGADIKILVKIESCSAVQNLDAILQATDGAMVARGDLGAEMPVEDVPILQNSIIQKCRALGKPVIVATNM